MNLSPVCGAAQFIYSILISLGACCPLGCSNFKPGQRFRKDTLFSRIHTTTSSQSRALARVPWRSWSCYGSLVVIEDWIVNEGSLDGKKRVETGVERERKGKCQSRFAAGSTMEKAVSLSRVGGEESGVSFSRVSSLGRCPALSPVPTARTLRESRTSLVRLLPDQYKYIRVPPSHFA